MSKDTTVASSYWRLNTFRRTAESPSAQPWRSRQPTSRAKPPTTLRSEWIGISWWPSISTLALLWCFVCCFHWANSESTECDFNCLGDIGCVNLVSRVKHISFAGWKQFLVGGQPSILKKNIVVHDVFSPHHVQLSIVFLQFDPPHLCLLVYVNPVNYTSRYIYF